MIAIVMPIYNGESTLTKTLESLLFQSLKFDELIIIDDASTDSSEETIRNYLTDKITYQFIRHSENKGLAKTYNEGINISQSDLIVTMHQDVILEKDALQKLVKPFDDDNVVATSHVVAHPFEIWHSYNFWQKCFFARLVGKNFSGLDGKFDCFRREALLKVGKFDAERFNSAGEDGDIIFKLGKIGKVEKTEAEIVHLHSMSPNFSFKDIIKKQKQYSESQGALLRLGRIHNWLDLPNIFFRELLIVSLFIPYLNVISVIAVMVYSFVYTKAVFLSEYRNWRILMLPFFNIFLLFVSLVYSLKGFVYGKQKI